MNQPLSNSQMRDAEALLHPYTNAVALRETGAQIIERGEGVRVYDASGRPFIEAMSGLWCAGLGFGNAELPLWNEFPAERREDRVEFPEFLSVVRGEDDFHCRSHWPRAAFWWATSSTIPDSARSSN